MDPKQDLANQETTSPNIGLSLSSTRLETSPGQPVETILKIQNRGTIVDRFHIKVEGLDPNWWTLSIPTFASFPGDIGESKLTISPPKEADAMAGGYSFRVKAFSEADPRQETIVSALLLLRGFVTWEIEVSPTRVVGRSGTYHITASNSGNADAILLLEGKNPEEALVFDFSKNKISVPAGGTSQTKLIVYPKKGEQRKLYDFQVTSKYAGPSKDVKIFIGQLEYSSPPRFPWWLLPVTLGIIGAVLIGLGIGAGLYKTTTLYFFTSTPYKSYMLPLIIGGSILLAAGALIGLRKNR